MENWYRFYFYPDEYLKTVYQYYAVHGVAYPCTYYHCDLEHSIYDNDMLDAASYETLGDLSGLVWEKINLLPIYNCEIMSPSFTVDEKGVTKSNQETSFNIPTEYNIFPTNFDYIYFYPFDSNEKNKTENFYRIKHFERATNTDITFWKIYVTTSHHLKNQIDKQIIKNLTFIDWLKAIYSNEQSIQIINQLEQTKENDKFFDEFYSPNSGLYFGA